MSEHAAKQTHRISQIEFSRDDEDSITRVKVTCACGSWKRTFTGCWSNETDARLEAGKANDAHASEVG